MRTPQAEHKLIDRFVTAAIAVKKQISGSPFKMQAIGVSLAHVGFRGHCINHFCFCHFSDFSSVNGALRRAHRTGSMPGLQVPRYLQMQLTKKSLPTSAA